MPRSPWLAITVVLAGVLSASASAATLDVAGTQVRYVAGPGELNFNSVQIFGQKVLIQEGINPGGVAVTPVSPCTDESFGPPTTPHYGCPAAGITSVLIDMGDQNDLLTLERLGLPLTIYGGD